MATGILYPNAQIDLEAGGYETLASPVARSLRDAILAGRLRPGEKIRQEAVAQEFNVSRIPVREALQQLQTEGLVSLTPNSGARVAALDLRECIEIYQIRERVEPLAIAESVIRLTGEQLASMRELVAAIEATDDPGTRLDLDRRFHLTSYAAAPMPRLLHMIEGFWNSTQQYRRAFYATVAMRAENGEMPATHVEHRLLLDACQRRDPVDAEWVLRSHIRRTRIGLIQHKELFEQQDASSRSRARRG